MFIFYKANFKPKSFRRDKEGHFILREGTAIEKI
jgi:hypothetical protein